MNTVNQIVGVDLLPPANVQITQPNFTYRQADAGDLGEFADGEFDVAISIGLLEHIHPRARLEQVVREHRRVARRYAAVTTHRFAFILLIVGGEMDPAGPQRAGDGVDDFGPRDPSGQHVR